MHLSLPSHSRRTAGARVSPLVVAAALTTACTVDAGDSAAPPESSAAAPATAPAEEQAPAAQVPESAQLPVDTRPEVPGGRDAQVPCPYLDTEWVANTNGQRMTGLGIDERFDPPACVFWSYPDAPQLEVLVRHMADDDTAIAVVDHFAPIDSTEPADLPGDWMGGRGARPDAEGAVYAVQRGNTAVIVLTNQEQSFKAEQVAEETIRNLGL